MSTKHAASTSVQAAGSSTAATTGPVPPQPQSQPASAAKIAKNKRLPATMVTPAGVVQASKHKSKTHKPASKKQKARAEKGKERAVELSTRLEEKVKGREERKAKRSRAKHAWD